MADESPRIRPMADEQNTWWVSHAGYLKNGGGGIRQFWAKTFHYSVGNHRCHDRLHTVQLFVTNERRNFCDVPTMSP
jgi:hypothetical protein